MTAWIQTAHRPAEGTRTKILEAIEASNQPLTRMEICERTGLTYFQVRDQTRSLIEAGKVRWGPSQTDNRKTRLYWLAKPVTVALSLLMLIPIGVVLPSWGDRETENITA